MCVLTSVHVCVRARVCVVYLKNIIIIIIMCVILFVC